MISYGHITYFELSRPRLRTIAEPVKSVDADIKQLIADMIETMYDAKGIGLAATQVDRHIQLIVMDLSENNDSPRVFINPKITLWLKIKSPMRRLFVCARCL